MRNLAGVLFDQCRRHGERLALVDDHQSVSYAVLAPRVAQAAARLRRAGLTPGRRVLLAGPNSVDWVIAAFGALWAGGVLVPVNPANPAAQRRRIEEQLDPHLLIAADDWPGALDLAELTTPSPATERCGAVLAHRAADDGAVVGPAAVDPSTPAVLMLTSGSTGEPKVVPLAHDALLTAYRALASVLVIHPGDQLLGVVPLSHAYGFGGVLLNALLAGASVRLVEHYRRDRIDSWLTEQGPTVLLGPPTLFFDIAALDRLPVGRVRRLNSGGADVDPAALLRLAARSGAEVSVGYGMTEACGLVAHGEPAAEDQPIRLNVLPGMEVRVAEGGRIWARAPWIAHSYWPALPGKIDDDGWYDTGDLGYLDRGALVVTGRGSDVVLVSGFTVRPAEVEAVLRSHPQISQAAVVGVPHPRQGQRLVAVVVSGIPLDSDELEEYCRRHLARYKVPRDFVRADRLPLTPTGKISKARLRAQITDH